MSRSARRLAVGVESGARRVFVSAVDWPGLSRSARGEPDALATLVAYGERYRRVVGRSPGGFEPPGDVDELEIVERSTGGAGTDFGVPSNETPSDLRPLGGDELEHHLAVLRATWRAFDRVAEAATGVELRKGPRGGGRDLEKIVGHAVEAERAYLGQLGWRPPPWDGTDPAAHWPLLRRTFLRTLEDRAGGAPPVTKVKRPWSPRYCVRRAAWHVLDHAWEIEDRAAPIPEDEGVGEPTAGG